MLAATTLYHIIISDNMAVQLINPPKITSGVMHRQTILNLMNCRGDFQLGYILYEKIPYLREA